MTDYYKTLGVSESATPEEIKKAYRKLANQHHPDKGGDQAKFKDVSVAYDTLSDAQKKSEYDQQRKFGTGGQQFHYNTNTGFDPFSSMFGGGNAHPFSDFFGRQNASLRRNRDLNIHCQITLLDSFTGKQLEANYKLPSGKNEHVVINVPAGIKHGETIRYTGLGDNSLPQMPRGNLNVTISVLPDTKFSRLGDDLYTSISITPIESMIGCRKTLQTLSGGTIDLEIRAGVESGVEFASAGGGFTNVASGQKGRFVTVVNVSGISVTDPSLIDQLKKINDAISQKR